jgi:hypothetical protein
MAPETRTIVIMQPTYLPWLGLFDLMDQADEMVLLDSVQFERHSWQHRNRIRGAAGEILLTVPVRNTGLATVIAEAQIADRRTVAKHLATIRQSYTKSPHRHLLDELEPLYEPLTDSLVDLLVPLIEWLRTHLGVRTPMLRSSTLTARGTRDDLLYNICKERGATSYLATAGSRGYMSEGNAFAAGDIDVRYHRYVSEPYPQLYKPFIPSLAALDAVLALGPDARAAMLAGRRPPEP